MIAEWLTSHLAQRNYEHNKLHYITLQSIYYVLCNVVCCITDFSFTMPSYLKTYTIYMPFCFNYTLYML